MVWGVCATVVPYCGLSWRFLYFSVPLKHVFDLITPPPSRADTLLGRPPRQTPPGRHPPLGRPHRPPARDCHCSGRYASYWNVFLLNIHLQESKASIDRLPVKCILNPIYLIRESMPTRSVFLFITSLGRSRFGAFWLFCIE